jgi:hypothetical protein
MTRSVSTPELLTEVEFAVLAGRDLAQIEAEIIAAAGLDEESQSAVRLYAWGSGQLAARTESITPSG